MKIHYIANADMPTPKAHGIQLAKMCEALAGCEANLELILPCAKKNADIQEFYGLKRWVKEKRLPAIKGGRSRIGFLLHALSFSISYFFYMIFQKLNNKTDLIYTIDLDHFSFLAVPFLRIPYFVEVHGPKKKSFLHSFFFKRANGIIATNNFIKKFLVESYGVNPGKVLVQPNGIDIEKFSLLLSREDARRQLNLPADRRIALYVGRFYPWKGLEILPEAARFLKDISFYVVGGSNEEFTEVLGTKNFPNNLIFAGQANYKEIPKWLAAADVLLVLGTSKNPNSYFYTSPMKFFEYMASGRPIVASRTPANENIVSEKEAFFYKPDNANDLASKIRGVFENFGNAEAKAKSSLKKASGFSWQKRVASILNFIEINANLNA